MFTFEVWTYLHILENVGVVARKYQYKNLSRIKSTLFYVYV